MILSIFKRKGLIHSEDYTIEKIVPGIGDILKRKILTAIVSSLLFTLFLSIGDFDADGFFSFYYLNLMFAITYGVIMSFVSDWVSKQIFKRTPTREIASFICHCGFGLGFTVLGLVSAIAFFITDRLLVKVKIEWLAVIMAFVFVVLVFLIMMNL